ncbi:class I SAM-dependent methyltransferase [Sphingomonas sp. UYP23]
MNANKALWEKGDFTRIAASMRDSGTALAASIGIKSGQSVLDLGCGDGTTAVPAAKLGADVLGVDIASNLVAAGNRRAAAEGLVNLHFQEGDASHLDDIENDRFDLVISIFGAMFAPSPSDVAKEMVRVTRPGGRIVIRNWIPGDPTLVAQVLKISSAYSPPPPAGFVSPMLWGKEDEVVARFQAADIEPSCISCSRDTYTFEYPGPPAALLNDFIQFYGPTINAVESAESNGHAEQLKSELLALFEQQNHSPVNDVTAISAAFLRVTVLVK